MAKKSAKKPILKPWASGRLDNEDKRFIQVGNSFLLSPKVQALKDSTRVLYDCMLDESGGQKEFTFPRTAAKKYGIAKNTLYRGIKELEENGFIKVRSGKHMQTESIIEFSLEWKGIRN